MSTALRKILDLLAQNKVTSEEADTLIANVEAQESNTNKVAANESSSQTPRYLHMKVVSQKAKNGNATKVDLRIPLNLLRAGVSLAYFIPQDLERTFARNAENERIKTLFGKVGSKDIDVLLAELEGTTITVDDNTTISFEARS